MALGPINIQLNLPARPQPQVRQAPPAPEPPPKPIVQIEPPPVLGAGQNEPAPELKSAVGGNLLPQQIQQKAPPPELPDLQRAIEQIQKFIDASARELTFSIHKESGRTIITVSDPATGEVIRTIPPEEALALSAAIETKGPNFFNAIA